MNDMKLQALADCIKLIQREERSMVGLRGRSAALVNRGTFARRKDIEEDMNACARQMVRLCHEAHCLCVELGFADLRDESHYTPARAGLGLSREILIERRRPEIS